MKKYILTLFICLGLTNFGLQAQELDSLKAGEKYEISEADYSNSSVEMADVMRSNGKIYVVVGAILILFIGFTIYAISIDRKLSRIEREVFDEKVNS